MAALVSHFISTRNPQLKATLSDVVFRSLAPDGGLYMPNHIPVLPAEFWQNCHTLTLPALATEILAAHLKQFVPKEVLASICADAFDFEVPLVPLEQGVHVMELFHGPSLAFKDFGARFMARIMAYLLQSGQGPTQDAQQSVHVLVATSGDTGGAVAMGFLGTPGIKVTILYPSGKVSHLQEKQLTALGQNIRALEVNGSFDHCQALVKQAFSDADLREQLVLTSANSINYCRLLPQAVYYAWAYAQLKDQLAQETRLGNRLVFSIPSGNYGNLCAALILREMGCPITALVASSNANNVVPRFLQSGTYEPKPTVATLSNAMDVGQPSNWERITHILGHDHKAIGKVLVGHDFSDEVTTLAMEQIIHLRGYVLEPHTAVGYLGLKSYQKNHLPCMGVVAATAHPAKFLEAMPAVVAQEVTIPERLAALADREKVATYIEPDYTTFRQFLLANT